MRITCFALSAAALLTLVACGASADKTTGDPPLGPGNGEPTPPSSSDGGPPKAKAGSLDASFGKDGIALVGPTWSGPGSTHSLLARADGTVSVFVGGSNLLNVPKGQKLARYDLDASGKSNKPVSLGADMGDGFAGGIVPRSGGGFLMFGGDGCLFLGADGSRDTSVGASGLVSMAGLGRNPVGDGKGHLFVDFHGPTSGTCAGYPTARVTEACALDTAWGKGGCSELTSSSWISVGTTLVEPSGHLFQSGTMPDQSADGKTGERWAASRLRPDGTVDASFGTGGRLVDSGSTITRGAGAASDGKGGTLVASYSLDDLSANGTPGATSIRFVRFVDGKRDTAFAPPPTKLVGTWYIGRFLTTEDGRIYAIGETGSYGSRKAVVMAFDGGGQLVKDFGDQGIVTAAVGEGVFVAEAIAALPAGKLTILIHADTSFFRDDGVNVTGGGFAVLRLNR